jgi:hypothetical protein
LGVKTYPWPQELIVGISPDKMRVFAPLEVRALLQAFQKHTGVDPLAPGVKLHEIMRTQERVDAPPG